MPLCVWYNHFNFLCSNHFSILIVTCGMIKVFRKYWERIIAHEVLPRSPGLRCVRIVWLHFPFCGQTSGGALRNTFVCISGSRRHRQQHPRGVDIQSIVSSAWPLMADRECQLPDKPYVPIECFTKYWIFFRSVMLKHFMSGVYHTDYGTHTG